MSISKADTKWKAPLDQNSKLQNKKNDFRSGKNITDNLKKVLMTK